MAKKVRINATMDPDHLARIDEYAERMGINRSAAICILTAQALDGQAGIRALSKLADQYEREEALARDGEVVNAPAFSVLETGGP